MISIFKKKIYLFIFFLILFLYNSAQIIDYAYSKDSYQYGDWLINYSAGFVRRGLIGEFFLILNDIFSISLQYIYSFFLIFLLFIFYKKNFEILVKIKFNIFFFIIIFSPFLFFFILLNHKSGVRKEYLLLLLFSYLTLDLYKAHLIKNFDFKKIFWKYIFFFQIILIIYEVSIFFFLFYILFFFLSFSRKFSYGLLLQILFSFIITFFITVILFINKGDPTYVEQICSSLKEYAYNECLTSGGIADTFSLNVINNISIINNMYDRKGIISYFILFLIYFSPLLLIYTENFNFKKFFLLNFKLNKKNLFIINLICYLSCLPLFLIGADWGRWLSILYFLNFYLVIFLILTKKIAIKKNSFFNLSFNNFNRLKKKLFILTIIIYASFATPGVFYEKETHEKVINFNYLKLYKKLNNF